MLTMIREDMCLKWLKKSRCLPIPLTIWYAKDKTFYPYNDDSSPSDNRVDRRDDDSRKRED